MAAVLSDQALACLENDLETTLLNEAITYWLGIKHACEAQDADGTAFWKQVRQAIDA